MKNFFDFGAIDADTTYDVLRPVLEEATRDGETYFSGHVVAFLLAEVEKMRARKDGAYEERNRVVAALMRATTLAGGAAGTAEHEDDPNGPPWDPEWRTVVYADLPTGQVSWHVHDSQRPLFAAFDPYGGRWDGHDTAEKYARVERFVTYGAAVHA